MSQPKSISSTKCPGGSQCQCQKISSTVAPLIHESAMPNLPSSWPISNSRQPYAAYVHRKRYFAPNRFERASHEIDSIAPHYVELKDGMKRRAASSTISHNIAVKEILAQVGHFNSYRHELQKLIDLSHEYEKRNVPYLEFMNDMELRHTVYNPKFPNMRMYQDRELMPLTLFNMGAVEKVDEREPVSLFTSRPAMFYTGRRICKTGGAVLQQTDDFFVPDKFNLQPLQVPPPPPPGAE